MMKNIIHTVLCLVALLLSSCVKDQYNTTLKSDKTEIKIHVTTPERNQINTKSGDGDVIDTDKVFVFVFNAADSKLREVKQATVKSVNGNITTLEAELTPTNDASKIYIAANIADPSTAVADKTIEEVKNSLKVEELALTSTAITGAISDDHHPMISEEIEKSSISSSLTIGSELAPMKLTRNTVKVIAYNETPTANQFELLSLNAVNAPVSAYLFPSSTNTNSILRYHYDQSVEKTINTDATPSQTQPLFVYESDRKTGENPQHTSFIIKGKYRGVETYYNIAVRIGNPATDAPLLRNCFYKINIKAVNRPGHPTAAEAASSPTDNSGLLFDVTVIDLYSYDIQVKDDLYFGVSNSIFVAFTDDATNTTEHDLTAVSISYTTKKSWSKGTIEYGEGIMPITGTELPIATTDGGRVEMDIMLNIDEDKIKTLPNRSTSVKFTVGEFHKEVIVRLPEASFITALNPYDGGEVIIPKGNSRGKIVSAVVDDPIRTWWLRLSKEKALTKSDPGLSFSDDVTLNEGDVTTDKLKVYVAGNEDNVSTPIANHMGYFYVSNADAIGRTKYCIVKDVTEIEFDDNGGHGGPKKLIEWKKQDAKVFTIIPTLLPTNPSTTVDGKPLELSKWNSERDGSGTDYIPGQLASFTWGSRQTLYAQWKTAEPKTVTINGVHWAQGNLIAKANGTAWIGDGKEKGALFRFGSLVGYIPSKLGEASVYPNDSFKAVAFVSSPHVSSGAITAADPTLGTGDPCTYYIGSEWRLPLRSDYTSLNAKYVVASSVVGIDGYLTYIDGDNTLHLPYVGYISPLFLTTFCEYATSEPVSATHYYTYEINETFTTRSISNYSYRTDGSAIRCVRKSANP